MLTITLPWPPSRLSPNRRQHWAQLAEAKKKYRAACAIAVAEQKVKAPTWQRIDVLMTFVVPDRRSYDRDNLSARMKAGLDGVCDALGFDDKRFVRVAIEVAETMTPSKEAACVIVTMREQEIGTRPRPSHMES